MVRAICKRPSVAFFDLSRISIMALPVECIVKRALNHEIHFLQLLHYLVSFAILLLVNFHNYKRKSVAQFAKEQSKTFYASWDMPWLARYFNSFGNNSSFKLFSVNRNRQHFQVLKCGSCSPSF